MDLGQEQDLRLCLRSRIFFLDVHVLCLVQEL